MMPPKNEVSPPVIEMRKAPPTRAIMTTSNADISPNERLPVRRNPHSRIR